MYPKRFVELSELFERLPGVGAKTGQRYAFSMLKLKDEELDNIADIIKGLKDIKECQICGFLSDEDTCMLCKDDTRDKKTIMVVAYPQDVLAIEKTDYNGLYHVLNGVISSSKGVFPEDINIDSLLTRLDGVEEIIIATSPTMDGEMTALYLDRILKDKNILVTRIAHGLPMGSSLDYADELTLMKAMNNRRKIEE